jgi:preprotein translocase subunit SecE
MSAKAESSQRSAFDVMKFIISVLLVIAGIAGFYFYSEQSQLYRILGLVAVMLLAAGIALSTASGKGLLAFMKNARTEVRKMVWPTRVETMQTTLMVVVIVILLSIFLWFVDMLLGLGIGALLR